MWSPFGGKVVLNLYNTMHLPMYGLFFVTYIYIYTSLAPRPPAAQQLDIGDNNCFTLGDNEYG